MAFLINHAQVNVTQHTRQNMLYKLSVFAVTASLFLPMTTHALEPIGDIAQTPLELTPTVPPNIMILLDDSGSMDFEVMTADVNSAGLFFAPNPDGTNFGSTDPNFAITHREGCELVAAAFGGYAYASGSSLNHYTPSASFGSDKTNCYVADQSAWRFRCSSFNTLYFDPAQTYEPWPGLRSDGTPFPNANPAEAPLDPYQVNSETVDLLSPNSSTTGVDAFRYYENCGPDVNGNFRNDNERVEVVISSSSSEEIKQNFANWFSYHRSRHLRAKALLGNFIVNQENNRIGFTQLNPSATSLEVDEMNASFTEIGAKRTLLDTLYSSTPSQTTAFASRYDTRYIQVARYLQCSDTSIFGSAGECPAEAAPAGICQPNHIILASDGFLDTTADTGTDGIDNADVDLPDNDFDGGPFLVAPPEVEVDGSQYRIFSDITMTFYKEDLHSSSSPVNLVDGVEPTEADRNRFPSFATDPLEADEKIHQHIKAHVVTFDVPLQSAEQDRLRFPGTIPGTDDFEAFPWLNPVESDIGFLQSLYHAAYSGRGEVISASSTINSSSTSSPQELVNLVSQGVGSTTPVAINTQGTSSGLVIYRTFFDSSSNSGDLVAQEIAINLDGTLNIETDTTPVFEWSAAQELDTLVGEDGASISQRNIITYSNITNDGIDFVFDDLDPAQQNQLREPLPNMLDLASERLDYLKGDTEREGTSFDAGQFRIRPEVSSTGGGVVHNAKLGTIANSAPVFVGQPQGVGRFGGAWPSEDGETYFDFQSDSNILNRDASIIVGANDGMLHVFDAESGNEKYAYIPSFVYDNLSALTSPEYRHRFFVDGTPVVEDAYISINGTSSPSWNTIVVGGLGAGGRGYYALDITDRTSTDDPVERVLWEFGPQDDPDHVIDGLGNVLSDLGLSFGEPVIAMSNAPSTGNKKWIAIFGNGYNSTSANGEAIIYILFIDQGIDGSWQQSNDLIKVNLGGGGGTNPNGISDVRAIDRNGDGTVDYLYAGDLQGKLHAVDISSTTPSQWDDSDNNYVLFEAEYNRTIQPITTKPVVVSHDGGTADDVIVVFATGSYFTNSDAINADIQSLYGVVDDFSQTTVSLSQLTRQQLTNEQFVDPVTSNTIDVRIFSDAPETTGDKGWFIDFDVPPLGASQGSAPEFPGEKAVRELQLRSGVLFVNTVIPQPLSCSPSPGGFSLAVDPQSGTAGDEPIFDINNDSEFNDEDSINLGSEGGYKVIVGTRFDSIPSDSTFYGDYRITQLSNTDIDAILTNTASTRLVGRQAWREVEF